MIGSKTKSTNWRVKSSGCWCRLWKENDAVSVHRVKGRIERPRDAGSGDREGKSLSTDDVSEGEWPRVPGSERERNSLSTGCVNKRYPVTAECQHRKENINLLSHDLSESSSQVSNRRQLWWWNMHRNTAGFLMVSCQVKDGIAVRVQWPLVCCQASEFAKQSASEEWTGRG